MLYEKLTFFFLMKEEEKEMKIYRVYRNTGAHFRSGSGGTKTMKKIRTNMCPI